MTFWGVSIFRVEPETCSCIFVVVVSANDWRLSLAFVPTSCVGVKPVRVTLLNVGDDVGLIAWIASKVMLPGPFVIERLLDPVNVAATGLFPENPMRSWPLVKT